jgi:large subunit ribosomal protein L2
MAQSRVLMAAPRTPSLWSCAIALRPAFARQFASAATPPTSDTPSPPASDIYATPPPAATIISGNTAIMRTYKPITPGIRHLKRPINDHLWKGRPYLPLTFPKKGHGKGGRNVTGKVTVRHHGGGHKRRIRTVDFARFKGGPQLVERIEYDPGRSAHIALLTHQGDGTKSYIVASEGMRAGDIVQSYRTGIPKDLMDLMGGVIDPGILAAKTVWRGNCLPLHMVPIGSTVFNLGSSAKGGAVFCRSAGTHAVVLTKDEVSNADGTKEVKGKYVTVKLQSGEIRRVSKDACATIGVASNPHHQFRQLGKAGRSRWLNIRPTVRGLAMNSGTSIQLVVMIPRQPLTCHS